MPTYCDQLLTPALLVDQAKLTRNCAHMAAHIKGQGVKLRPHLKTAKSADMARLATKGHFGGITVSTVAEARYFAEYGVTDICYAVGVVPDKIAPLAKIARDNGAQFTLICDNVAMANAAAEAAKAKDTNFSMLIEMDCGDGRAGVAPDSDALLAIATAIDAASHLELAGVLTHAGHSYGAKNAEILKQIAEDEVGAALLAANRLTQAGYPCPVRSIGSTPTALQDVDRSGISEVRAGIYMFYDLVQIGIGVCSVDDIALSVLASVIGHHPNGHILIDAGGLALSKDTGAAGQGLDVGYGLVCDIKGEIVKGAYVSAVSQEHGHITLLPDSGTDMAALKARFPLGSKLRILPNHGCMMAAPYDCYHVTKGDKIIARWEKLRGW